MAVEAHEPTIQFFTGEVADRTISDTDIIAEFFQLSQTMDQATINGFMKALKEHRPQVAQRIERELHEIREG